MNRAKILFSIGMICAAAGGLYGARIYQITHPKFAVHTLEVKTFRLKYPSDWPKVFIDPQQKIDDIIVENNGPGGANPAVKPWDYLRNSLFIHDEGTSATEDVVIKGIQPEPYKTESLVLENGVRARTWVQAVPMVDVVAYDQWIVFSASNGHVYSVMYELPYNWKIQARYDFIFHRILGSMEFK